MVYLMIDILEFDLLKASLMDIFLFFVFCEISSDRLGALPEDSFEYHCFWFN